MTSLGMMQQQRFGWLYHQKARYPLFCALGLFTFFMVGGHDTSIYFAVQSGEAEENALDDLYFPYWNLEQNIAVGQATFAGMLVLIGYAIAIKLAQRHYEKHGISV